MSQISRGGHRPPALMNVYVYTYIFDVMKIVYSILHAMRAIVCVGHERANMVSSYKIAVTLWYLYSLFLSQCLCLYLRASNERPYWIVGTITILRSGIICFFDITNYLHEHKKSARRADCNFCLTNHPNKCTILEEPRTTRLDIRRAEVRSPKTFL